LPFEGVYDVSFLAKDPDLYFLLDILSGILTTVPIDSQLQTKKLGYAKVILCKKNWNYKIGRK
jgi:hypothetical protein